MGLMDQIKQAFQSLPSIAASVGALALIVVIMATVLGVFVYQVISGGSINIDGNITAGTGSSALINSTPANMSSLVTTVWSAGTSVAGFIVLAVIAAIAVGILGKKFLGGGRI